MYLQQYTGRGVRIAVIDSGVHSGHPHIVEPRPATRPDRRDPSARLNQPALSGLAIREDGSLDDDYLDRLGHGTAVTAAIREKVPDAEIVVIKLFWRRLTTDVPTLIRAIDEACARDASVVNLSLGTADFRHRPQMEAAIRRAADAGAIVVSAIANEATRWLPGSLEGAVAVRLDWTCPREAYRLAEADGRTLVVASGYPREIPGVSRERNLKGISFAVANATGFVARAREASPRASVSELFDILAADASD